MTAISTSDEVLDFWFAPGMERRWYDKDPAFDAEVRARLLPLHRRAAAGQLEDWRAQARSCLALVVLLDQVPRNAFRDAPRAFATDGAVLALARHALAQDFDRQLPQVQRMFLYLPLQHSEDLADQEDSLRLFRTLDELPDCVAYAQQHRDIIARFGRFPHRNAILGRESTPEEEDFLKQEGSSF